MKRKNPDTSKAAYKFAQQGLIESHHEKIKKALEVLGIGNYERISEVAKIDRTAVNRRLKEMREGDEPIVYLTGTKSPTRSGCMANDYCLTAAHVKKTENPPTYREGVLTSTDHSKKLIELTSKQLLLL